MAWSQDLSHNPHTSFVLPIADTFCRLPSSGALFAMSSNQVRKTYVERYVSHLTTLVQAQFSASGTNSDGEREGAKPKVPRRTPMACQFCRGASLPSCYAISIGDLTAYPADRREEAQMRWPPDLRELPAPEHPLRLCACVCPFVLTTHHVLIIPLPSLVPLKRSPRSNYRFIGVSSQPPACSLLVSGSYFFSLSHQDSRIPPTVR